LGAINAENHKIVPRCKENTHKTRKNTHFLNQKMGLEKIASYKNSVRPMRAKKKCLNYTLYTDLVAKHFYGSMLDNENQNH